MLYKLKDMKIKDMKKVAIMGQPLMTHLDMPEAIHFITPPEGENITKELIMAHINKGAKVIVVNGHPEIMPTEIIQVNDKLYELIPKPRLPRVFNRRSMMVQTMATSEGGYGMPFGNDRKDESWLDGINIVSEFELIQQKKSNLSKSKRDHIEYLFNKQYREIQK